MRIAIPGTGEVQGSLRNEQTPRSTSVVTSHVSALKTEFVKLKAAFLNSLPDRILDDLIFANQMSFHNSLIWNRIK